MKSSDYWRKRARRTNNPADWSTCKNLKHQVRKLIRVAEGELLKIRFKTIHGTQIVFGKQFACVSLKDLSPQKTVADEFNNFFASVGKSTYSKIESLTKEHNFDLHESAFTSRCFPTNEQFTFNYVECKQVADIINGMPSNNAPGIDKVPTRVLKDSLPIILPFITSIINVSLSSSTFPDVWKTAENYTYSQTRQLRTF